MGQNENGRLPIALNLYGPEHLSLKVQNVEFDFDVSVSYCMLSTDTSKLNSRLIL